MLRRRGRRGGAWGIALAAVVLGCGDGTMSAPDVVARIDGREVRYAEFELYLAENSVESEAALGSDVLSGLFDRFLEEELLRRLVVERGLMVENAPRRAAVQVLLAEQLAEEVSRERIEAYYRAHLDEFRAPERVELRQLLVEDRAQAELARSEWVAGRAYEEIVRRHAENPEAHRSSEGQLAREDLPPVFADTIFHLEVGEISEIVPADYGFHIFQVTRRMPAEVIPLEEVEGSIRRRLSGELADQEVGRLVDRARERYEVRVFKRNIPFNYAGLY
ncbi:MAG: peptidyl-prolyl cis-trans isomerase [Thermoanaerobaculia bacterium]